MKSFSALQRAENSSIWHLLDMGLRSQRLFQCSSASRKFLNSEHWYDSGICWTCFSALQRAENSSIFSHRIITAFHVRFSALQRAENSSMVLAEEPEYWEVFSFSALQRAENSSIL